MGANEHNTTRYLLQDTWNEEEDQDLRQFLTQLQSTQQCSVDELSVDQIVQLDESYLRELECAFCDTRLIQSLIPDYNLPLCYPNAYNHVYHRNIQTVQVKHF